MKLELYQEGQPQLGDILVYCGKDTWCAQPPEKAIKTYTEYPVYRTLTFPRADHYFARGGCLLAVVACIIGVMAYMRAGDRRYR